MRSFAAFVIAVLVSVFSTSSFAACPVPGSFVATTTGRLPIGVHVARLSEYAFTGSCDGSTGSGTVDERFWSWQGDDWARIYGSAKVRIGDAVDPDYSGNGDRKKKIQGQRLFQKSVSAIPQ